MCKFFLVFSILSLFTKTESFEKRKICLYDCFEQCNKVYYIPIPKNYVDLNIIEGNWERRFNFYYKTKAILYITNDGGSSLNYNKFRELFPTLGIDTRYIAGNDYIPYGWKDVSKDVFDYGTVPHTIYYSGKDDNGYWADYQTPHINVGYINASSEQRELFDKVIKYVMENIPNKEVEVHP